MSGSDTAAFGGELAYLYATQGSFAGTGMNAATAQLAAAGFGVQPQEIQEIAVPVGVPLLV